MNYQNMSNFDFIVFCAIFSVNVGPKIGTTDQINRFARVLPSIFSELSQLDDKQLDNWVLRLRNTTVSYGDLDKIEILATELSNQENQKYIESDVNHSH